MKTIEKQLTLFGLENMRNTVPDVSITDILIPGKGRPYGRRSPQIRT
ncbi:MAG: hypothetical protein GY941_21110 [Planctomycetes bacterium]|nr:hypothetical protein [Planctomycetota bacterium]